MIRTKTTLVIGTGAGNEIEMPDGRELLNKVAQGFDFARLGSDLQTRDMVSLDQHFEKFARRVGATRQKLHEAGGAIRTSARIASSVDAILEQHGTDPLVQAAGKLAIIFYTLQGEARSPLGLEPRDPGDLPLRGNENWLFQLGRLIVDGVPRAQADKCFDNLTIINFNYDRAVQHYLPWVVSMAFGMTLNEARQLVGAKLNIVHPFGNAGRLPWEPGETPDAEWGNEEPWNIHNLVKEIRTASEVKQNHQMAQHLVGEVAGGKRIAFLGFGFEPAATSLLFDYSLSHDPDVLVQLQGANPAAIRAIHRLLKRQTGIEDDGLIAMLEMRSWQMLRDYALLLEN